MPGPELTLNIRYPVLLNLRKNITTLITVEETEAQRRGMTADTQPVSGKTWIHAHVCLNPCPTTESPPALVVGTVPALPLPNLVEPWARLSTSASSIVG